MERSFLSVIVSGLLGITTLGSLGFAWAAPGSPGAPPSRPEGGWRLLDPITYENISIFSVVTSSTQDTSPFLTLDEGLSTGEVIVVEHGASGFARTRDGVVSVPEYRTGPEVNQLVLINRSKRPLLLLAGELVSGGKQDRIIAKDRIVAPGAEPLPLDVFCVEHGRWSSGSQFAASKTIVHPSVREQAALESPEVDRARNRLPGERRGRREIADRFHDRDDIHEGERHECGKLESNSVSERHWHCYRGERVQRMDVNHPKYGRDAISREQAEHNG